jgi:hypothetical protein
MAKVNDAGQRDLKLIKKEREEAMKISQKKKKGAEEGKKVKEENCNL